MMRTLRTPGRVVTAVLATAATLTLAACGGSPEPTQPAAPPSAEENYAAARYTAPLADVCPPKIVLQWNWWPQAEHGFSYQLIGPAGRVDPERYTYTGPLGGTGVELEIRSGGPATGRQLPHAQLYQDDSILLGVTTTEDSIGNSLEMPTVSVFAYNQKTPLAFYWGNPDWNFKNLTDIKNSGQTVLAFDGAPFIDVLVGQGLLDEAQIDQSYTGEPGRFIAENGNIIQQGFVSSEVYKYQHDIPQWGKPVKYVLVGNEYKSYNSQISIRADKLEANRACLERLVPLFQQAAVDYANDPGPTNRVLLNIVEQFRGSGWTLTPGILEWAVDISRKEGILANGPDGVFGSFDLQRIDAFIAELTPVLEARGKKVAPGLTAEKIVTNEFLDERIRL
mgnify:CR=1 FL=1